MGLNSAPEIRAHEAEPPPEVAELQRLRVEVVNLKGDLAAHRNACQQASEVLIVVRGEVEMVREFGDLVDHAIETLGALNPEQP